MANQVVDQDRVTTDAQRLARKVRKFGGLQMMREKAATDQIETVVVEGKRARIGHYGAVAADQVRLKTIKVGDVQRDSFVLELAASRLRHVAKAGSDFEHGKTLCSSCVGDALDQLARGGDSAEPAVDAANVAQGSLNLDERAGVRIENL